LKNKKLQLKERIRNFYWTIKILKNFHAY